MPTPSPTPIPSVDFLVHLNMLPLLATIPLGDSKRGNKRGNINRAAENGNEDKKNNRTSWATFQFIYFLIPL
jgi:hypothetical protein